MIKIAKTTVALVLLAASATAFAQGPVQNIDPSRPGNLAAAQNLVRQAYDKMTEAQVANNADLGGHAARAKTLLREVNQEIKLAAEAANQR